MTTNGTDRVKWEEILKNLLCRFLSIFAPVFLVYFFIFLVVSTAGIWIDFGNSINPQIVGLLTYGIALSSTLLSDFLLQESDDDITRAYNILAFFILVLSAVLMYVSCKKNETYFAYWSVFFILFVWSFTYSIEPKFAKRKKAELAIGGTKPTLDKLR
jgi:hypothetical protein